MAEPRQTYRHENERTLALALSANASQMWRHYSLLQTCEARLAELQLSPSPHTTPVEVEQSDLAEVERKRQKTEARKDDSEAQRTQQQKELNVESDPCESEHLGLLALATNASQMWQHYSMVQSCEPRLAELHVPPAPTEMEVELPESKLEDEGRQETEIANDDGEAQKIQTDVNAQNESCIQRENEQPLGLALATNASQMWQHYSMVQSYEPRLAELHVPPAPSEMEVELPESKLPESKLEDEEMHESVEPSQLPESKLEDKEVREVEIANSDSDGETQQRDELNAGESGMRCENEQQLALALATNAQEMWQHWTLVQSCEPKLKVLVQTLPGRFTQMTSAPHSVRLAHSPPPPSPSPLTAPPEHSSHELPIPVPQADTCTFFAKAGFCPRRPLCKLDHTPLSVAGHIPATLTTTHQSRASGGKGNSDVIEMPLEGSSQGIDQKSTDTEQYLACALSGELRRQQLSVQLCGHEANYIKAVQSKATNELTLEKQPLEDSQIQVPLSLGSIPTPDEVVVELTSGTPSPSTPPLPHRHPLPHTHPLSPTHPLIQPICTSDECTQTGMVSLSNACIQTTLTVSGTAEIGVSTEKACMNTSATNTDVLQMVDAECSTKIGAKELMETVKQTKKFRQLQVDYMATLEQMNQEKSQRMVAEELLKIVQSDFSSLRQKAVGETTTRLRVENELGNTKTELAYVQKQVEEKDARIAELEESLTGTSYLVRKLEEQNAVSLMNRGGIDYMVQAKLAEGRAQEAEQKLMLLQVELLQSQNEVRQLLSRLGEASRERSEMVSSKVHNQLLQMADEKALNAECRAQQLQREVEDLKQKLASYESTKPTPPVTTSDLGFSLPSLSPFSYQPFSGFGSTYGSLSSTSTALPTFTPFQPSFSTSSLLRPSYSQVSSATAMPTLTAFQPDVSKSSTFSSSSATAMPTLTAFQPDVSKSSTFSSSSAAAMPTLTAFQPDVSKSSTFSSSSATAMPTLTAFHPDVSKSSTFSSSSATAMPTYSFSKEPPTYSSASLISSLGSRSTTTSLLKPANTSTVKGINDLPLKRTDLPTLNGLQSTSVKESAGEVGMKLPTLDTFTGPSESLPTLNTKKPGSESDSSDWSSSEEEAEDESSPLKPSAHAALTAQWEWRTTHDGSTGSAQAASLSPRTPPTRRKPVRPPPTAPKPRLFRRISSDETISHEPPSSFQDPRRASGLMVLSTGFQRPRGAKGRRVPSRYQIRYFK